MAVYYVDYENVKNAGIEGLDKLKSTDVVIIFYNGKNDTMKVELVEQLHKAEAEVVFSRVEAKTANALDFELITMLYYTKAEDSYIISKDTGYDAAIQMGKKLGMKSVQRKNSILESLGIEISEEVVEPESVIVENKSDRLLSIKTILNSKCKVVLNEAEYLMIANGLPKCENKNQFDLFFRKQFGEEKGRELYKNIRGQFNELKLI